MTPAERSAAWYSKHKNDPELKAKYRAYQNKTKPQRTRYIFDYELRRAYGIDCEDWARMFHAQNKSCAACGDMLVDGPSTHVDHCHSSGVVRGLVCQLCNMAIGCAKDSASRLAKLISYLESRK